MDPSRLNWNFQDTQYWRSFWNSNFPTIELSNMQSDQLLYQECIAEELNTLERKIERTLVTNIENSRSRTITRWNRLCSRTLQNLIIKFENALKDGKKLSSDLNLDTELQSLQQVYKMSGFPLNFAFKDIQEIVDAVKNTDVAGNEADNVEFALSVKCFGYPGPVLSVWVYVANLTRLRKL